MNSNLPHINNRGILSRGYLTAEQSRHLCECIAYFMSAAEINASFNEKYGIEIKRIYTKIYNMKRSNRWNPMIEELRAKFIAGVHEVAGSHKRVRMERRELLYEKALKSGQIRNALIAVKHQEEEMEGIKSFHINVELENLSDAQLEEKKKMLLERISLSNNTILIPQKPQET